jgi:hypothetical protein
MYVHRGIYNVCIWSLGGGRRRRRGGGEWSRGGESFYFAFAKQGTVMHIRSSSSREE